MAYEERPARIDRFAGLSDRSHPVQLTRIENPALKNVEFSERVARQRYGFSRVNSARMKDGSIRLDGQNDYLRFRHITAYQPSLGALDSFYVGIGVMLRGSRPSSTVTIANKGFGVADNCWRIQYNPTAGTGSLGAWVFSMYDPTTPATHTITIDDGDGATTPVDQYRYLEFYSDVVIGVPAVLAYVYKEETGVSTPGSSGPVLNYTTSSEDITLGVSMSASNTIGTDFANVTLCEFRYFVGTYTGVAARLADVATYNDTVKRHSRELIPDEYTLYDGYWKLNDGNNTGVLADLGSGGNNGLIPEDPAVWVSTEGETLGQSGIQFLGHNAFVALWEPTAAGALTNPFNTTTGTQVQRWTVRGIFVPKLATGETTVRDQTIFWAGTSATVPGPVALQIRSNQWYAIYRDGSTTRALTIGGSHTPTLLVNKRVRFALVREGAVNAANFRLLITYLNGSSVQTFASATVALTNPDAAPDTVSQFWFIGRHVTSVTLPYTFGTGTGDGGAYGVVDDFQIVHTNNVIGFVGHGGNKAFTETSSWGFPHFVTAYMKMNEGGGDLVKIQSEVPQQMLGFRHPAENDGAHWDVGLVQPYRSPECSGLFPFNRTKKDGSSQLGRLAISGCTIYDVNTTTGALVAIGAVPKATTKWTKDQYAQTAILASDNGHRPLRYDGSNLSNLGIRAPLSAPNVTTAAGGTFTGTYWFYVTYYNKTLATESNPGPGVSYTLSAQQVTQVILPLSPDPQVTGRRLYVTLAGGADGSLAFLLKDFDDNTQTTWGAATTPFPLAAITAPVNTGRTLEYFDRQEAPIASIVKISGDNLFLAGDPVYPTRVYRSAVGEPDYFNHDEKNVDLDLDTGDPITGMQALVDSVFVGLRDGWGRVWNTGDSNNPIGKAILSKDHGPCGPHAMLSMDRIVYYVSERDVYRTDGLTEENVSSPPRPDYPSVQQYMKENFSPLRRRSIVMAQHRGRKQIWIAYTNGITNTRNNRVLVYDIGQGIWSDYEMSMDFLAELEDANDEPFLYGASEGYIVKLDQQGGEGGTPRRLVVNTYVSGDCPYITYTGAVVAGAHGLPAFCYKRASNSVVQAVCEYSEAGKLRFYKADLGLAAGDVVIVGAARFQMDFVLGFGDSLMQKRLKSLTVSGKSNDSATKLRLQWIAEQGERSPTMTTADQKIRVWPTNEPAPFFELGGLFRTVRLRLTLCDDATGVRSSEAWPSTVTDPPTIYGLLARAEVMDWE